MDAHLDAMIASLLPDATAEQKARLTSYWAMLSQQERLVFNKLITGAFRVGVSALLVTRATFNVSSFMGIILMIGLVVKNGWNILSNIFFGIPLPLSFTLISILSFIFFVLAETVGS